MKIGWGSSCSSSGREEREGDEGVWEEGEGCQAMVERWILRAVTRRRASRNGQLVRGLEDWNTAAGTVPSGYWSNTGSVGWG